MDNIYNDFKPTLNEIEKSTDQTNKPLTSLLKSDFKLSPHAPAFVPRFSIPSQQQQNVQQQQQNVQQQNIQQQQQNIQQYTNYYNDPKYQQNFPDLRGDLSNNNNQQYAQQSENNVIELSNEILKEDDYYALNELNNFIENISKNPALYEANIQIETEILNNWILEDPDIIMECVVNNIMDQAIMDSNFRYNGVRFCLHLISNLLVQTSKGSFKEVLLQRCKREHSRRDALSQASDNGLYLRGLTFFIGDLSTKLDEADLKFAVPDLCKTLLKNKSSDNLKCCCQVLKLCGKHLNQFLIDRNQIELLDSLFNELKEIVDKEEVENSVKNLINSTIELYKNNWETPQSSTPLFNPYAKGNCNINQQNPFNNQYNNNQINEYDNQFNQQYDEQLNYDFGPCGDENDEDVCDAFEEFLRQSNQI